MAFSGSQVSRLGLMAVPSMEWASFTGKALAATLGVTYSARVPQGRRIAAVAAGTRAARVAQGRRIAEG
jgi:hypothetical protein